ncbi:carboxypeptidase-like regulatory domain-containing protein [Flavobacterium sp. MAH-1]|uniref:Carboxypeptidase-like regulatory domain-containing protein n=1 Tax=Flavobacterium agri TaxID=2743471 RepID=A0A7Y8XZQ3_9FLAO|nr:carboxypeptidase-like regulatory domain-containing protein [Flavobacterium agri]NUY79686.1 carboxypeptidase-like regulatory domain-containing protein [Flavobacterium agri]NYA69711.1 carboxypeptidase-like regulatory domain-containing protein [Flavobacterium agri]
MHISVPKPCHENWHEMTQVEKGRFCSSCQKKAHDFTMASDREIIAILRKSDEACGRFLPSQLEREIVEQKEKSTAWSIAATGVLGLLSMASAQAQEKEKPDAVLLVGAPLQQVEREQPILVKGEVAIVGKPNPQNKKSIISGTVSDANGPLPGAIVAKDDKMSVQTDADGKYSIEAKTGDTLTFSFVGMKEKSIQIGTSQTCDAVLEDGYVTIGVIVTTTRPNLIKRTYYHVRNWFR